MKSQLMGTWMIAAILISAPALAKTNIAEKVSQLKENAEASKVNLKQYEDNLKTVDANLAETDKALKALEKQRQSLNKQTSDTAKGKASVDAVKKQLEGFLQAEQGRLDAEQKQIEELRKTLAQLEANQKKRQENILAYQDKMKKVDTELAAWSERNQSIVELEQAIGAKEDQAKADRKRLAEKKTTYEAEVGKWRKQVRVAERSYENFSKLKD